MKRTTIAPTINMAKSTITIPIVLMIHLVIRKPIRQGDALIQGALLQLENQVFRAYDK